MRDPLDVLRTDFGHDDFRGHQREAIDRLLAGRHTMLLMPTGGGKSLAFQVPALCYDPPALTVVVSPLIALMKDQVDALRRVGIDADFVNSSLRHAERNAAYDRLRAGDCRLLYVTPERFRKPEFRDAIARRPVPLLAIDEAHCVSQWGHDFRTDYSRLAEIRHALGGPTVLACTATATRAVQRDIVHQLGLTDADVAIFHQGIERPNLELAVEHVWGDDEKTRHLVALLHRFPGPAIVYFSLIKTLERLSRTLNDLGVTHLPYHGDLDAKQRRHVQDAFMHDADGARVVLATNAFGMGVDKPDIRTVTHAETPGSVEAYYQEIGRAGRDGQPARCTLLYDPHDLETQMRFLQWSNPSADYFAHVYDLLKHDAERVQAFGIPWLREQLHDKQANHDHRLPTALNLLERHGVLAGDPRHDPTNLRIVADLPPALTDDDALADKLRASQQRLLAVVEYANHPDDRKQFLDNYFMTDAPND